MAAWNCDVQIGATRVVLFILMISLWAPSCGTTAPPENGSWFSYEPTVVELKGRLTVSTRFGPPNYGENPETDQKLKIPVLVLSNPVNVRGDPEDELNIESFTGLRELQLTFLYTGDYNRFVDQPVVVRGTLSRAISGHHFTDVVLAVEKISRAP